jgi:hypothetical protein
MDGLSTAAAEQPDAGTDGDDPNGADEEDGAAAAVVLELAPAPVDVAEPVWSSSPPHAATTRAMTTSDVRGRRPATRAG